MLSFFNQYLFGVAVPILLMLTGIYFGFRLRWFHLRHPMRVLRVLTEKNQGGGVSPARALSLALAGTLGVGNIVGVSAAIAMGGFGAIFWMWVSALCAMLLKYAEIVLAVRHRRTAPDGTPYGAAMYYIRDGFTQKRRPLSGKALAALFALLCILNAVSMGSIVQISAISDAMEGVFSVSPWLTGSLVCATVALILRKGSRGILSFTDKLVPIMTLGYLVLSLAVLAVRADEVPYALARIVGDALTPAAGVGGVGGFLLSRGVRYGTMRGLISNEAGCGTAPTAHASADCTLPAKQGIWGIFEVFADTILLCTLTALVVIVSYEEVVARESDFLMMTVRAYSVVLGEWAAVFMGVAVLLFGFATVLCWAHYGCESLGYLSTGTGARRAFVFGYCASVLVGAFADTELVWSLADFAVGAMTLINLCVLLMMNREVREETDRWLGSLRKSVSGKFGA